MVELCIAAVVVWAFANAHPALAIGLMVAVFVVPELVLVTVRVRRSRAGR